MGIMFADDGIIDGFMRLFRGRGDVYGHEEGRCVKEKLTRDVFYRHLDGVEPIGVYPCVPVNGTLHVVWGCSDFDAGDSVSWEMAQKLHGAFKSVGVTAWIERSRSKGYHVWVFAETVVPAIMMRNMFLAAHQVADIPAKEVNPKQTTLASGQYGNYVRLPYPDAVNDQITNRRVLNLPYQTPMPITEFVTEALLCKTPVALIEKLAGYYVPPVIKLVLPAPAEYSASMDEAMTLLSPLGKVIWRDGPLPDRDRSGTLLKLGYECVKSGLNPSQTKTIITSADIRWGKYHLRPHGEIEIDKLVIRVHN